MSDKRARKEERRRRREARKRKALVGAAPESLSYDRWITPAVIAFFVLLLGFTIVGVVRMVRRGHEHGDHEHGEHEHGGAEHAPVTTGSDH